MGIWLLGVERTPTDCGRRGGNANRAPISARPKTFHVKQSNRLNYPFHVKHPFPRTCTACVYGFHVKPPLPQEVTLGAGGSGRAGLLHQPVGEHHPDPPSNRQEHAGGDDGHSQPVQPVAAWTTPEVDDHDQKENRPDDQRRESVENFGTTTNRTVNRPSTRSRESS